MASDIYECLICGKIFPAVQAMYHLLYDHGKDDHNRWLKPVE